MQVSRLNKHSAGTVRGDHGCRLASFASRISRCRIGNLSIEREISRTSQGKGFLNCTRPSLDRMTSMKPRGRSFLRTGDSVLGSVSVRTTTSRSTSASGRAFRNSNCAMNAGSFSLSAKTTMGRFFQTNSLKSESFAGRIRDVMAGSSPFSADTDSAENSVKTTASRECDTAFIHSNIGGAVRIATGKLSFSHVKYNERDVWS